MSKRVHHRRSQRHGRRAQQPSESTTERRRRPRVQENVATNPVVAQLPNAKEASTATPRRTTAVCVFLLLGAGLAMAVGGLLARLHVLIGHGGMAQGALIGGALLAGAAGVRVPQRLAVWVCVAAWGKFIPRRRSSTVPSMLINQGVVDLPLYWLVLSVIALAAGVLTALLPLSARLAGSVHDWMHLHFVWSAAPHAILHAALAFGAGLIPLAAIGLAVCCAHHISCRHGLWDTNATGWVLVGSAAGTAISASVLRAGGTGELVLVAAALPALLVTLICVASSLPRRGARGTSAEAETVPLPDWSDRWPTLLRASIVAVSTCGVCMAAIWHEYLTAQSSGAGPMAAAVLLPMGVGFLIGRRVKRSGYRSIGGFGVACASAGIIAAVGAAGLLQTVSTGTGVAFAAAGMAAAGFASAYGHQTLLSRVAARSSVGATILARILAGGALALWIGAPALSHLFGPAAAVCVLGLALMALGAALILREPYYSPRTRRVRLLAVFGAVAVMVVVASQTDHSEARNAASFAGSADAPRAHGAMSPSPAESHSSPEGR